MQRKSKETIFFEKCIMRVNKVLRLIGMHLDEEDVERSFLKRLRHRLFFVFNSLWFNNNIILQFAWVIDCLLFGGRVTQITFFVPCFTLCLLGDVKAFFFFKHGQEVNNLVFTLKKLQATSNKMRRFRDKAEEELLNQMSKLNFATYSLWYAIFFGISAFVVGPFIIMGFNYQETGRIKLELPFFVWYPFDATDARIWPFIYVHQVWTALISVISLAGTDNYFSMCCTFIHIQFRSLHYDIERISIPKVKYHTRMELHSTQIVNIIERHRELTRCVEMLEKIYSKSTLLNVATSSLVICISGFNITAMEDYVLAMPFIGCLAVGLFQIYVFCYYGDLLMKTSMEVGDAVYNSQWYEAYAADMKDLLFISTRSLRPCKLTAYGFADINLSTYCRIMGTAWSYFALIRSVLK